MRGDVVLHTSFLNLILTLTLYRVWAARAFHRAFGAFCKQTSLVVVGRVLFSGREFVWENACVVGQCIKDGRGAAGLDESTSILHGVGGSTHPALIS